MVLSLPAEVSERNADSAYPDVFFRASGILHLKG